MIRSLLALLLLLSCAAHAQSLSAPVSLVPGDVLSCFNRSEGNMSRSLVSVQGMPFTQAMHLKTGNVSATANAWDIRSRCFTTYPAAKDSTVVATFWMRTTAAPDGKGFTTFVHEQNVSPYAKSVTYSAATGAEWKRFQVPFAMADTFAANTYNFSFWVTYPNQEIEIGGISIMNYGPGVSFSDLNLDGWPYDGHAADAPWRKAANDRIEKYRKTDLAVVVRDDAGAPIPGAQVHLKLKRHAFGFGTAIAHDPIMAATADGARYREEVPKLFNKIVFENTLKWPVYESSWGREGADAIFNWLPSTGITMARGHNLIWPGVSYLPQDVIDMLHASPVDKDKLRARIDSHFTDILSYTKGRLTEWDVLNEPYNNKDVQAALGDAEMAHWFQLAKSLDPNAKLYINDYSITESGGNDFQHQNGFFNIIKFILDNGGPIEGIGLQSHFDSNLTPPDRVYEVLDRFASFGKELQVTEFDVNVKDEQAQADYTRDYLTICFSHPAMKGFMLWGFWAGAHWLPDGAMYRLDWSERPMLGAWKDLIYKQWWTDVQGTTDANGVFRTRGFLGDYDADVAAPGKTQTVSMTAGDYALPAYASAGKVTPGEITAAGIVNAASFLGDSIAPGEVVTLFGGNFGSPALAQVAYADGKLPTFTGDTRVLFDGVPAPMIYSLNGQVSAIVPYSVSGQTRVEIEYQGIRSNAVNMPVASSAPGIYCYSGGKGQAVAVTNVAGGTPKFNKDAPAPRGSYVTFFLTGEGAVTSGYVGGTLPATPNPKPAGDLKISIGGVESKCQYNWSGLIYAGVLQVNACVPADAPSGNVALEISLNGVKSQPDVTISVQ
jgi:endo-1,4-beta-xylanase